MVEAVFDICETGFLHMPLHPVPILATACVPLPQGFAHPIGTPFARAAAVSCNPSGVSIQVTAWRVQATSLGACQMLRGWVPSMRAC
eukprot:scaffold139998_cov21-Tisochrysis_lutea.AAC.1